MMNLKKCSSVRSTILQLLLAVSLLQLGTDPDPVRVNRRADPVRSVRIGVQSAFTHTHSLTPPLLIHPKSVDAFDANPVFAELHELGIPSLLRRVRTRVFAYLAEDPGPPPPISNEVAAASESDSPSDASGASSNLTQEEMDLIEILWKQDEDLGVSRDTFDYHAASESSSKEAVKPTNFNSTEVPEDEDEPPEMHEDSNPWEGFQYSIDSETGEHILGGQEESKSEEPRERVDSGCFLLDEEEDREAIFAELERIFQGQPLQAADLYPADDCWGGSEQRDLGADKGPPLATGGPPPHNYTDPFPGVLLNNATLGPPPVDHSSAYLHGAGAFGATACTGLPCNNGSSMSEGPTYGQDFPDYLYSPGTGMTGYGGMGNVTAASGMMPGMASMGNMSSNVTNSALACTPTDYLLNDLLADEDLHLMDMVASPTETASAPYPVQLSVAEDRMDNSSDTGVSSMGSERVPSLSEDHEWLDSCSESSSSHADVDSDAKRLLEVAPKKYKLFGRRPGLWSPVQGDNDAMLGGYGGVQQQPPFATPLGRLPGGATVAVVPPNAPTPNSLFPSAPEVPAVPRLVIRPVGSLVQHNHSYSAADVAAAAENCESSEEEEDEEEVMSMNSAFGLACETEEQRHARASRDEKRARALNLPLSNAEIVDLPIDEFNERLAKYELTEAQLALIRDIRRRGKNKVAAQNCRKRKLDQILSLQQDVEALHLEREELERRHEELLAQRLLGRDKYSRLCQLLATHTTRPLSPTLQHFTNVETSFATCDGASPTHTGARLKKKMHTKWESDE
ncbi:endoplasmic reticulum membrane sensor NFE2L1 isoform X1 [Rhipicephalus sanguineus]|uniref:endoplasmic reticulum membrane sensor NFE2L1 isoform X1 n=1 Tax=Rhipicephalus sanguineus TaxID=34632 RepID=UPI001895A30B|nr:endoplasmic reticulum membrane sensor NFE2L1 isoform X1 [Rhipicephalus sanguineus]